METTERTEKTVGIQEYNYPRVWVNKKAYDLIAKAANETNRTINDITSVLIEFAIKHVEFKEVMEPVTKLYLDGEEI